MNCWSLLRNLLPEGRKKWGGKVGGDVKSWEERTAREEGAACMATVLFKNSREGPATYAAVASDEASRSVFALRFMMLRKGGNSTHTRQQRHLVAMHHNGMIGSIQKRLPEREFSFYNLKCRLQMRGGIASRRICELKTRRKPEERRIWRPRQPDQRALCCLQSKYCHACERAFVKCRWTKRVIPGVP